MNRFTLRLLAIFILHVLIFSTTSCTATGKGSQTSAQSGTAQAEPAVKVFKTPQTFKNTQRNYEYTIPAGWFIINGDPTSDKVNFMKSDRSMGFIIYIDRMSTGLARDATVAAGLAAGMEDVKIGKLLEAVSRNDGAEACGVIGWEITEATRQSSFRRIVWEAYDSENLYFNFNANAEVENFEKARPVLREIMDSIKFCR